MTDKQIKLDGSIIPIEEAIKAGLISENDIKKVQRIIDGVDVSGCEYFRKDDPCKNTCQHFCTPCEWVEIQNCMYKYGKRKEQECDMWKNLTVDNGAVALKYQQQLDQLKEKLNKLKSRILCENEDDLLYELMKIIEE